MTDREGQAIRHIAAQQVGDDSRIHLKVVARLTDQQLAAMVRLRDVRPRKKAVSVRLDERVLDWLKSKGRGHLTLINDILANMNSISAGNLVGLESRIAIDTLRAAANLNPKPVQVICLDHAFEGNDQLKTNIVLEMEAHDIQFRTV